MFFEGSRYLNVPDYRVPGPDGVDVACKRTRPLAETESEHSYEVKQGDRPDLLSQHFYRTPGKWWLICDANPGVMSSDQLLEPGRTIRIPRDQRP